jgi:hypothetical protein
MFTTAGLGLLWTVSSRSTTLCVSLRRDERTDRIKLRGLARFASHGQARDGVHGLGELKGRQYSALISSLPVPAPRRAVKRWAFGRSDDVLEDLVLPAYGCGQVVGADERGRAVALSLFGPEVRRTEVCGTLHLAQQVVLRALGLGARVRVHTHRAAAWVPMTSQVADEGSLRINDQDGSTHDYSVEMFDGTPTQPVRPGVTTMVVRPTNAVPSREADVTLELLDRDRDLVRVDTGAESAVVTMVATDDEMRYLKSSFDMAD